MRMKATKMGSPRYKPTSLQVMVKGVELGLWPTPTTQDAANNGGPSQASRHSPPLNSLVGGPLNPTWVEWLMGFPLGWTDLGLSGTQSSPRSPSGSGVESSTPPD
jgi:hypothetical protein